MVKKAKIASKKKAKASVKKKAAKKPKPAAKKPTLAQRIAKAKRESEKAKNKIVARGEKLFNEAVKELFKTHKGLQNFSWPQYTPHWNDGDECTFGCYFDSLAINDERDNDDIEDLYNLERNRDLLRNKKREEARIVLEIGNGNKQQWEIDRLNNDLKLIREGDLAKIEEKYKIKKSIHDLLEGIDESSFENMFGEGLVVVSRDGTDVQQYSHD